MSARPAGSRPVTPSEVKKEVMHRAARLEDRYHAWRERRVRKGGHTPTVIAYPGYGDGKWVRVIDGRPETIRKTCEDALKRLQTDVIDLYYLHRWDKKVPIEDSVGALSDLVRQGKIQSIGLSEVSASTLRKAHAVHPIAAVQTEYSLWTRNPEIAVLKACEQLGTTFVAFSPVARGFLCGPLDMATLDAKDIRKGMPRFTPENYAANFKLFAPYQQLSREAGCSPAQLALAWLLHKAPHIIPIPGTTSVQHLLDDVGASDVRLTDSLITQLNALINEKTVQGNRYSAQSNAEVDTEVFESLTPQ
jgi:aryl-alcohol dehydrogenase-like predicted oxidoreductase